MVEFLPSGIRKPSMALDNKKKKIMITLYGPYGDFKTDLIEIGNVLRTQYGFFDCRLVIQRSYSQTQGDLEVNIRNKSFHFLRSSNVVIFIFFCDKKGKIAHGESPASELTYLIDKVSSKIRCCFVLIERGCSMGSVVFGHLKDSDIMYEVAEFPNNLEIAKIIEAKCRTFLNDKYHEIQD